MRRLRASLADELAAVLLAGSHASGDAAPCSDLDVIVIVERQLEPERALALASVVGDDALPVPAEKLELVAYTRSAVRSPRPRARFEVNLNSGRGRGTQAELLPWPQEPDWFLLDLAITRELGRALHGPAPAELIGPAPPAALREALRFSLEWWERVAPGQPSTLLSACRTWRWAAERRWSSKRAAGEWALARSAEPGAIEAALAARAGGGGEIGVAGVAVVLAEARASLGRS